MIFGRQENTDELYFKIAGLNWANSGSFNAPELSGIITESVVRVEDLYFLYMPLYSFLFGVSARIFEFNWQLVVLFDAVIHLLLVWIVYFLAKKIYTLNFPSASSYLALIPAVLVFPIGQSGRPDELAMVFGYLGIFTFLSHKNSFKSLMYCGIYFGLCALTSSAALITLGIILLSLIIFNHFDCSKKVRILMSVGLISFSVFALGLLITLINHPKAYEQYLIISQLFTPVFDSRYLYHNMIKYGFGYLVVIFLSILLVITYFKKSKINISTDIFKALWVGTLCATAFVFLVFPIKYTYLWFMSPFLLLLIIGTIYLLKENNKNLFTVYVIILLALSPAVYAKPIRDYLIQFTLEDNQTIRFNENFIKEQIPPGSTVITQRGWWYLAGENYHLLDSLFSNYSKLDQIDYIILTGNGSGKPGTPHLPAKKAYQEILASNFIEVANNLKTQPNKLFSIPLSNSGNGHGVVIYQRKR